MKKRLSLSVDDKLVDEFDSVLKKSGRKFSSKSHAMERAIELLIEEINNE